VAGTFYPDEPERLLAELERAFGGVRTLEVAGPPKALIAPHAGYVYSGPVAATAYAALRPLRGIVSRVVVMGPSHRVRFAGLAVPTVDLLATPLGDVPIDAAGRDAVIGLPGVRAWDLPHDAEHSVEVHLPFIRHVLGEVAVLPVVVGDAPAEQVAAVLEAVWGGPETVIVLSTDLSHYHPHAEAVVLDRATSEAIQAGRANDIGPHDACGSRPLRGLMVAAARHGLRTRAVDLRTSGDTAGPQDRVVGYGAFVLSPS
jgi:MEMO1 family protein